MDDGARFTSDPLLGDHRRFKKRLIAPWNQHAMLAENYRSISWHIQQMPEEIWISELINALGPVCAFDALLSILSSVYRHRPTTL